jgi:DNA-binding CsgD family transcriptional regulator
LERLLRFVGDAEGIGGGDAFTPELLVDLGRLIEADWVAYHETDYVGRRVLLYVQRPGEEDEEEAEAPDDEWDLMEENPICRRWRHEGRFSALRVSDVTMYRDFRQTRFYAEFWQPWGIEHELKVRLPSPPWHGRTVAFHRGTGKDFTARDRRVLEALAPHLNRLSQAAATRRLLRRALAELAEVDEQAPRGVIFFASTGEVEFVSPPAQRLVRDFFPRAPAAARVPAALAEWIASGQSEALLRRRGDRHLVIERAADALILHERGEEVSLTAREREVLGRVARGKTNAEIAELLWLAPSTVRKHLENVYAKLGVNTRTAAVARFLRLVDAEAS